MRENFCDPCLIVFEERGNQGIFRYLKRGFRHCFAILLHNRTTVSIDFIKSGLKVVPHDVSHDSSVIAAFAALGASVVRVRNYNCSKAEYGFRPLTCVELVKQLIGIRGVITCTPYALFKNIISRSGSKNS